MCYYSVKVSGKSEIDKKNMRKNKVAGSEYYHVWWRSVIWYGTGNRFMNCVCQQDLLLRFFFIFFVNGMCFSNCDHFIKKNIAIFCSMFYVLAFSSEYHMCPWNELPKTCAVRRVRFLLAALILIGCCGPCLSAVTCIRGVWLLVLRKCDLYSSMWMWIPLQHRQLVGSNERCVRLLYVHENAWAAPNSKDEGRVAVLCVSVVVITPYR